MKSSPPAVPLTIAIIGGVWLAWQQWELTGLQSEAASLTNKVETSKPQANTSPSKSGTRKTPLDFRPIDWALVSKDFQSGTYTNGFYRSTFKLDQQIRHLSLDELIQGLKDIENGGLDERMRLALTRRLLKTVLEKDPAHILLSRSDDPKLSGAWRELRIQALGKWAKTSPHKAAQWFDSQPPDSFSPKENQYLLSSLIGSLTVSDFPLALERFETLSDSKRIELMRGFNFFGSNWEKADFANHKLTSRFAELTRRLPKSNTHNLFSPLTWLGDQDRPASISSIQKNLKGWSNQRHGSLSMEVFQDYLTKIRPTSSELKLCIDSVISAKCLHLPDQPERGPEDFRIWLHSELKSTLNAK